MKDLINKAYEMGKEAFGKFGSAPALNGEFIRMLPNCLVGDTRGCNIRLKMYKAYIKGWTVAHLKSME